MKMDACKDIEWKAKGTYLRCTAMELSDLDSCRRHFRGSSHGQLRDF